MDYIKLAHTNTLVSTICLGCLNFGSRTSDEQSKAILNRFLEAGGNFLDTANNYAFWNKNAKGGESERLIGDWLHEKKY